jgi:uncharacterized membrane protein
LPPRLIGIAALVAASLAACAGGGASPARQCPDDVPSACAAPAPGFSAEVAPLVSAHCSKCHAPGGVAEKVPFDGYDQIVTVAGDMKLELETCQMPPDPEPALTASDRHILFAWIACGAPND